MKIKTLALSVFFLLAVTAVQAVPFKLLNKSMKSIHLKIPGVMNPNLSPESSSGVDLKVGQKVFFFVRGRKYLLLEVTEDLRGKKLVVNELIKELKVEYGLK